MRILAIDPGNIESGWVLYDSNARKVEFGGTAPNEQIMGMIKGGAYGAFAIERIAAMGMAVGETVFQTVFWTGRMFQEALHKLGDIRFIRRVKRAEEKIHLCGSMKAKDGNIRQALIDKLGEPGTKKNPGPTYGISGDAWAALAVAVVAAETQGDPSDP